VRPSRRYWHNFWPSKAFRWHSCSTPLYHKLSVALTFLLMSLSHALSQHSVTRTKNFLSRARPAPSSTRTRTHISAGSHTHPANVGRPTRNQRRSTRPAQDFRVQCPPSRPHTFSARVLFEETFAQPVVFAVVNCPVVALSVFYSTVKLMRRLVFLQLWTTLS